MNPLTNQKGYLLLEILLSVTLISLIFTVFFGYFIQSRTQVIYNQGVGSASQLSQEILVKVRDSREPDLQLLGIDNELILSEEQLEGLMDFDFATGINVNNHSYFPVVTILHAEKVITQQTATTNTYNLDKLDLIKVEILEEKKGVRAKVYETFGYRVSEEN